MNYISLNKESIQESHICCAISDKKCIEGYNLKKEWLTREFENGYVFKRIDERAKVFIEYGPAEHAWAPIDAANYLFIGCLWVSGKYKKQGHAKALLQEAIDDAQTQNRKGLVTIVGKKKFHFMSDTKWFLKQGFVQCDQTDDDFVLLVLNFDMLKNSNSKEGESIPQFKAHLKKSAANNNEGFVVYYSNRCPFTEYHINTSLVETVKERNIDIKVVKLNSASEAQKCPTSATIFSLFYNGTLVTTDLSVCMTSRFDKIVDKELG